MYIDSHGQYVYSRSADLPPDKLVAVGSLHTLKFVSHDDGFNRLFSGGNVGYKVDPFVIELLSSGASAGNDFALWKTAVESLEQ